MIRIFYFAAATGEGCARKCPLANFHGRRSSNKVTVDNTANNLLAARRLLQEELVYIAYIFIKLHNIIIAVLLDMKFGQGLKYMLTAIQLIHKSAIYI